MVDFNKLKTMEKAELIALAKQVNAPFHHNNGSETLIENIINKVMEQSLVKPEKKPEEVKISGIKEDKFLTEEELEEAFAPIKERVPAFSTVYDHESKCCTMKYRNGKYRHAETMSMSCPVSKFVRKANEIARGPLILRGQNPNDWESISAPDSKNAYTNTVL